MIFLVESSREQTSPSSEMTMDNVILNIYDLLPETSTAGGSSSTPQQQPPPAIFSSLVSSWLSPLGMGAYHTSIDVRGFRYQFGANVGITRTASPQGGGETADSIRFVPPNGSYKESIILGQTWSEQGEINAIIQRMRDDKFRGDKYHLVQRNCNHFSETFALALIMNNELLDEGNAAVKLDKFPQWVNRLARVGSSLTNDDMTAACDVIAEARIAAGVKGKVGWDLTTTKTSSALTSSKNNSSTDKSRSQKKVLTEKQKAVLAKLKK
jgi:hypothetical protein